MTIVVDRKMPQAEADKLLAAFKSGAQLHFVRPMVGVAPTGSVSVGGGLPTPTRLTIERPTDKGQLLTIVADKPILQLGAGVPGAKPKEGYDFAHHRSASQFCGDRIRSRPRRQPRVTVKQGAFVVDDYSGELVKLNGVSRK